VCVCVRARVCVCVCACACVHVCVCGCVCVVRHHLAYANGGYNIMYTLIGTLYILIGSVYSERASERACLSTRDVPRWGLLIGLHLARANGGFDWMCVLVGSVYSERAR